MQFSNVFVIIYCVGAGLSLLLNQWLEYADFSFRRKHGREIPPELSALITADDQEKICAYENAKYKVFIPEHLITTAFDVLLLFSGFYPYLFNSLWGLTGNVYFTTLLFAVCASVPSACISLPFELFSEFVIEKRFSFSTITFKLWLQDKIKSVILTLIVASFLLTVMTVLLEHVDNWWWALGTVYVCVSLLVSFIYPRFIAPLFNKFTPLENGELRNRVVDYLAQTGFNASGVFIMDASKRSNHSNAYFTGFGKNKRVVLYDTLVNQLTVDELGAVLGHELGHYKKHHIVRRLCIMVPLVYAALFIVNRFTGTEQLYTGFGFSVEDQVFPHMKFIGLFLLSEVSAGYGIFARVIENAFSRRDEYAADQFAARLCGSGKPLASALIKLNKENKSEIQPARIYSIFNYSHPTLLERIRAVE
jgi:STE24 endopeptidase